MRVAVLRCVLQCVEVLGNVLQLACICVCVYDGFVFWSEDVAWYECMNISIYTCMHLRIYRILLSCIEGWCSGVVCVLVCWSALKRVAV